MLTKDTLAERLKHAIDEKGITQITLAEKVGTSAANISNYVKAKVFPPVDTLCELAKALDKSLDWLCALEPQQKGLSVKSVGDVARVLEQMRDWVTVDFTQTERARTILRGFSDDYPEFEDVEETLPSIVFCDGHLQKFFDDSAKMRRLRDDGTIDDDLFERWYRDRLKSLDSIPISTQQVPGCFPEASEEEMTGWEDEV